MSGAFWENCLDGGKNAFIIDQGQFGLTESGRLIGAVEVGKDEANLTTNGEGTDTDVGNFV